MARRIRPNTLQPLQQPTWLVTRDKHGLPLEWRQFAPGADHRAILMAARAARIAEGWTCTEVGRADNGYFAERAGERVSDYIGRYDPAGQTPCGGFKSSGYGREQGVEALTHYTQVKSVIVRL